MRSSLTCFALVPLLFATAAIGADKPKGLSAESPFAPVGGATVAGAPANENLEFAGVTSIGKRTDLIFFDKTAKKSHWLAKGETKAGITLLNYDPQREQAVVKVNGIEKVLTLRKGQGAPGAARGVKPVPSGFNTPSPSAVPAVGSTGPAGAITLGPAVSTPEVPAHSTPAPVPSGPVTPEIQARQESEARMLVSDLLEIGMAQRRAYEEAQRKAAEGNTTPPAGQTPAPATPDKPNGT